MLTNEKAVKLVMTDRQLNINLLLQTFDWRNLRLLHWLCVTILLCFRVVINKHTTESSLLPLKVMFAGIVFFLFLCSLEQQVNTVTTIIVENQFTSIIHIYIVMVSGCLLCGEEGQ